MQLLKHFKNLTLHPNNAKGLKGLILKLAVQGKLTDNWRSENSEIESAKFYLDKIKAEKERLIKEKKIKKEKPLSKIGKDDLNKDQPTKWETVRLGEIGDWGAGSTPLRSNSLFYDGEINWFKSGELNNGIIDYESKEKITDLAIQKSSLRLNNPGDVLIAMYGATIGKTGILNIAGTTNQAVCACTPFSCITSVYLHLLLKALKDTFINQGEGGAQPNISRVKIRNQVFGLPPLEEQKEIVRVVEILFKEVEQLEQLTVERITLKEDFVTSALNQLTTNNAKQEWEFLQEHFKSFFNETSNIKKLRETVLQLAVQGKLTADWRATNPDTEDACILLKRIQKEKAQLVKDKKIKKETPLPPITKDEIPYELPEGWAWCRMGDIAEKLGAGSTPSGGKSAYVDDGIMFFRSQNVHNYFLKLKQVAFITDAIHERMKGTKVQPKDLLLNITGGSIGRCAIVPDDFDTANVSQHVAIVRLIDLEMRKYLHSLIISKQFQDTIMDVQVGVSREGLSMTKLKLFLVPLPPLEEQKAIVQKVNALMGLCDTLEGQVQQSQKHSEQLMQSCLREVFNDC